MRERIQKALFRLASVAYQDKYIVNGTKDEYVLPFELLDSACSLMEATPKSHVFRKSLSELEHKSILLLVKDLRSLEAHIPFNDPSVSNHDLIMNNQYWREVRKLTQECLAAVHWDYSEWERENVGGRGTD